VTKGPLTNSHQDNTSLTKEALELLDALDLDIAGDLDVVAHLFAHLVELVLHLHQDVGPLLQSGLADRAGLCRHLHISPWAPSFGQRKILESSSAQGS
jgi:hypothetical protein